jgi:hypothetical protein
METSTSGQWSSLYRDALVSVFSFVEFKQMPSVLRVCRNWLSQSKHEKCRDTPVTIVSEQQAELLSRCVACALPAASAFAPPRPNLFRHVTALDKEDDHITPE